MQQYFSGWIDAVVEAFVLKVQALRARGLAMLPGELQPGDELAEILARAEPKNIWVSESRSASTREMSFAIDMGPYLGHESCPVTDATNRLGRVLNMPLDGLITATEAIVILRTLLHPHNQGPNAAPGLRRKELCYLARAKEVEVYYTYDLRTPVLMVQWYDPSVKWKWLMPDGCVVSPTSPRLLRL